MSHAGSIDYLSAFDLFEIAAGVLGQVQVRDAGSLASAAARPSITAFGEEAYATFAEKAAALMHSLARNHALVDGNKRLAWSATRAFCLLNGHDIRYTVDAAETFVVAVAGGELDLPEITAWMDGHLVDESHE